MCVVDNGSADGSADMVAAEFPQARLIRAGQDKGGGVVSFKRQIGGGNNA